MPPVEKTHGSIQRVARLSPADCKSIAARYDGTTETLDALLHEYRLRFPLLERHQLQRAAKRGGYVSARARKAWTARDDDYIRLNWHSTSGDAIAAALGRSFESVNLRRKRIGVGRYDGSELTIRDVEEATRIDHRQWHDFVERGWLRVRRRERRAGAAPITYVTIDAVLAMLRAHPEVFDYCAAPPRTRNLLELDSLPTPPKYKRVTCQSTGWTDQVKPTPIPHHVGMASCGDQGGTHFWAPLYATPACPRCGCKVSRYSPEGLFTDLEPDQGEVLDMLARKLGLRWIDGALRDDQGAEVRDRNVLAYVFGSNRSPGRAVEVFQKLISKDVRVNTSEPVGDSRLLDDILGIELRPDQQEALQIWLRHGSMTAAHAMSFGKSTLVALTRLAGRHLLIVDTALNREQWVAKLRERAPSMHVVRAWAKPVHTEVTVFDRSGAIRCVIEIYTYQTRTPIEGSFVLGCFDEVHRLPARASHRHALVTCEFRLGMSSTARYREDGRGELVHKLTGALVGDDWGSQLARGTVQRVPVRVLIVDDVEHKHEVVGDLLKRHRVAVLCERLEDGLELERRYGIPFVHGRTKDKLQVIRSARSLCLSRVGDAGISMPNCEITVDHSGLFGSRSQSLQRLGRLMHSERALYHVVLMTPAERSRFSKRIDAIREKGFDVTEEVVVRSTADVRPLIPPAIAQRVSAQDNPFMSLLGWRKDECDLDTRRALTNAA